MKILCPECFSQITDVKKGTAVCGNCGSRFDMKAKTGIFKVRLDGGYIKEGMTHRDVVKSLEEGGILADEYIAAPNGPWITIYDSPFVSYIPKKGTKKLKSARTAVTLYRKRRAGRAAIIALTALLGLSAAVNIFLLTLMNRMQDRIEILVGKITGG